jgi:LmbE family N-acetylglucosaminyl deacetylase
MSLPARPGRRTRRCDFFGADKIIRSECGSVRRGGGDDDVIDASAGVRARGCQLIVVAPHPDDDVLGCGALIAGAAQDRRVRVCYVTDGSASHVGSPTYTPARLRDVREREAARGLRRLGVRERPTFLRWPDGTVPSAGDAAAAPLLDALRAFVPPDERVLIAAPWRRDHHCDHRAVASLVAAVLRERPNATRIEYTVWLGVLGDADDEPRPDEGRTVELDSRPWLGAKRAALREHRSQSGRLIRDAATAFTLPPELLARALGPVERYIVPLVA